MRIVGEPKPAIAVHCCEGVIAGLINEPSENAGVDDKMYVRKIAKLKMSIVEAFLEMPLTFLRILRVPWFFPSPVHRKNQSGSEERLKRS